MTKRNAKLTALLIAMSLILSGCGSEENTIVTEPLDAAQLAALSGGQEASYQSEGYYAPNTVMNQDAPVVPAPATLDEIKTAASEAAKNPEAGPASDYARDIPRGDINIGLVVGEAMDINPLRCTYQDMMNLNTQVFEGLVALDTNQQPTPQLADRWEGSGNTWRFTLRSGVKFHDGSLLTPEDVIQSYDVLKNASGTYWHPALQLIKSMSIVDESTIQVTSATQGYMTLYALTFPIVQRNSLQAEVPIGTGPYLISQYSAGNAIRLEKSPVWWKHTGGTVNSIVGLFYRENQSVISAMETGEIDTLASEYPTASIGRTLSDRATMDYATLTYECIVPNLRNPILADHAVREALMYAIDRNTLAQTVYTGMVQETEVPVVPGSWLYEKQAAKFSYNPEHALAILNDAGWEDGNGDGVLSNTVNGSYVNLSLRIYTADKGTTSTRSEACQAIQAQLALVGIKVEITTMSHSDLAANMKDSKFDLALCAFELGEVPNLFFLLNSGGPCNYAQYNSGEMDQYLRAAYDAPSAEELVVAMSRIQMKCVNDLPILGLFFRNGVLSSRTSLDGVVNPRRGYVLTGIATGGVIR